MDEKQKCSGHISDICTKFPEIVNKTHTYYHYYSVKLIIAIILGINNNSL